MTSTSSTSISSSSTSSTRTSSLTVSSLSITPDLITNQKSKLEYFFLNSVLFLRFNNNIYKYYSEGKTRKKNEGYFRYACGDKKKRCSASAIFIFNSSTNVFDIDIKSIQRMQHSCDGIAEEKFKNQCKKKLSRKRVVNKVKQAGIDHTNDRPIKIIGRLKTTETAFHSELGSINYLNKKCLKDQKETFGFAENKCLSITDMDSILKEESNAPLGFNYTYFRKHNLHSVNNQLQEKKIKNAKKPNNNNVNLPIISFCVFDELHEDQDNLSLSQIKQKSEMSDAQLELTLAQKISGFQGEKDKKHKDPLFYRGLIDGSVDFNAVFGSTDCIELLMHSKHWLIDCTYKTSPKHVSKSVMVIHSVFEFQMGDYYYYETIPSIYFLLTAETEIDYLSCFRFIKNHFSANYDCNLRHLKTITTDFEIGLENSVLNSFYWIELKIGCYFHFMQAVYRNIRYLGLQPGLKKYEDLKKKIKLICYCTFLPADICKMEMTRRINELLRYQQRYRYCRYQLVDFCKYMKRQWLRRQEISFSHCNSRLKTNNHLERYNRKMHETIGPRPHLYQFLNQLRYLDMESKIRSVEITSEDFKPKQRRYDDIVRQILIQQATDNFQPGSEEQFLQTIWNLYNNPIPQDILERIVE